MSYECTPVAVAEKGKDKCTSYAKCLADLFHLDVESGNPDMYDATHEKIS